MFRLQNLLLLLLALAFCAQNAFAAPLLQEGKKALYQRVVSHPQALLYQEPDEKSPVVNKGLRPFTALYVYERGEGWLNVGVGTNKPQGWIKKELTTAWNQSLTLLFTPRTGRDPVLFFRTEQDLTAICEAQDMETPIKEILAAVAGKKEDSRIVAAEPSDSAVDSKRFYLMPILETKEPYDGTKFLHVASIDPGDTATPAVQKNVERARAGKSKGPHAPRTGIAFVVDTTISMGPYIAQCKQVIKTVFDRLEKSQLIDNVGFAVVAFRSSTARTPKLDYTTLIAGDFVTASNRSELESNLADLNEAKVSSHDYNEDSLAGIYQAVESLSWEDYDSRIIMLITDAGPLKATDPYTSVRMGPEEMNDFARQKGIWVIALHVKSPTPAAKRNHAYAEDAYKALSRLPDGRSNYQAIKARDADTGAKQFGLVADTVATTMANMVQMTAEGKITTKPKDEAPRGKAAPASPAEEARRMAERLGYALQLEYLGRQKKSAAPEVVDSWIADMDLIRLSHGQRTPNVEVAVLLTKNQLSDLRDSVSQIIDNAERTKKTDAGDFFKGILSASARMARDPNIPTQGKTLSELGVLGEYLEGLPYRSEVMLLTEEDWYRKSVGEQTAFINRLRSKVARYEEYDRDRRNWESFGMSSAGDWVYRVPLNMLP